MTDKTSDSGIWLTDDGKVVHKQPEGGAVQLVRPGGRVTDAVQARIDSTKADPDAPAVSAAEALGVETATSDAPVETAVTSDAAKPRPAKKAAAKKNG